MGRAGAVILGICLSIAGMSCDCDRSVILGPFISKWLRLFTSKLCNLDVRPWVEFAFTNQESELVMKSDTYRFIPKSCGTQRSSV